jgi:hypothetical protein
MALLGQPMRKALAHEAEADKSKRGCGHVLLSRNEWRGYDRLRSGKLPGGALIIQARMSASSPKADIHCGRWFFRSVPTAEIGKDRARYPAGLFSINRRLAAVKFPAGPLIATDVWPLNQLSLIGRNFERSCVIAAVFFRETPEHFRSILYRHRHNFHYR